MNMKKKTIIITAVAAIATAAITVGAVEFYKFYKAKPYELNNVSQIMKEDTKLIAHRGYRAVAPENTYPAFDEAGKAGFWGNECDIYRTADGVWVIHHDFVTFRMMNALKNIEKSTYAELLELHHNNGHNIDKYEDLKICTVEEYLEICKKYNMNAFIELKSKNNTEHYDELLELIHKYGVDYTFISFEIDNLRKIRELDKDVPLFLVVDDISDESIELAKSVDNCGIDFDVDDKKNYENDCERIKKCISSGLEMGCWACDEPEKMQRVVDLGVKYITTDCLTA